MCPTHYARTTERVNHPLVTSVTEQRLDLFFSSHYASQNLDQYLDKARYDAPEFVQMSVWSAPGDSKPTFEEGVQKLAELGQPLSKGFLFGPSWTNHWVKVDITIPDEVKNGGLPLIFEFDPSSEALIFLPDATPLHGITGGKNTERDGRPGGQEDRRIEHVIPPSAVKAGKYSLYIEVSCNGMFGVGDWRYDPPPMDRTFKLSAADLVVPNQAVRDLRADFVTLRQVADAPEGKVTGLAQKAMHACNEIMNAFRFAPSVTPQARAELVDSVAQRCREIGWEVLGSLDEERKKSLAIWAPGEEEKTQVWAIGHCHIDTAWLWRYTQTQQKVARSWTTQCDLMDRWPNHQFAASSAQQYLWLEKLYPAGFERVKAYIEKGRFHTVGGAWLEHDCLLPSGESLVRQYLSGQRYFKSRFGHYCKEAWLPDTFGYASQLPQILRLAGMKYFFTQKISWNNITVFPYNSFNWCGIDGSQVLAHMTPVDSYNAQCNYGELLKAVSNNKNLAVTDQALLLFGNGDGGGGPTPAMLEKIERLSSLERTNRSAPSLKMGSPGDFFDDLCKRTKSGQTLPTWRGELYLEFHRGTYTNLAANKFGNRTMEILLGDLEFLASLASIQNKNFVYPKEEIYEMWCDTMLNQFHDVLPGTSIGLVNKDVKEIFERRIAQAKGLVNSTLKVLATESQGETVFVDTLRLPRNEVVRTSSGELGWLKSDHTGLGRLIKPKLTSSPRAYKDGSNWVLENARLRLTISNGRISSLFDIVHNRELILAGPGAETAGLMIYDDHPLRYDAWDVEIYHLEMGSELLFDSIEVALEDPLRASLRCTTSAGTSTATLTFSLDAMTSADAQPVVRIASTIDWHERHKVLKFVLPVDVHSSFATYGTQFGLIERPTHRNNLQDQAKFEVCAHGFADLSESAYGVALSSKFKYGYSTEGNTMRLSLLRAPATPDPDADQGVHEIYFSILPHAGPLSQTDIIRDVMRLNRDVYEIQASNLSFPTFVINGDRAKSIVLETIKRAEDEKANEKVLIFRVYESAGGKSTGSLKISGLNVAKASWVDILEDEELETCVAKQEGSEFVVSLDFRRFEIKTLKVQLK